MSIIWHDIECGGYTEDLPLWRTLAAQHPGAVLDVGAGTGRVTLDLARAELAVTTVVADARSFALESRFSLCVVPMQTVQLLGGARGRGAFLRCARAHLIPEGVVAIAIADQLDLFDIADNEVSVLPDIRELDGVVYSSSPTAVREDGDGFLLIRNRETISVDGQLSSQRDEIRIDALGADELEREGVEAGLQPAGRALIAQTPDHVGSAVVILSA